MDQEYYPPDNSDYESSQRYQNNLRGHEETYYDNFCCKRCGRKLPDNEVVISNVKSQIGMCKGCKYWLEMRASKKYVYINLIEFLDFYGLAKSRSCRYCGLKENDFWKIELLSTRGTYIRNMGVDRIDSDKGYEIGNVCLCCVACNMAKSNHHSEKDMIDIIGPAIRKTWESKLKGTPYWLL